MIRSLIGFAGLTALACASFGQSSGGFKSYKNQDDYCRDNPKMPTCIKMGPIPPGVLTGFPAGTPAPRVNPAPSQPRASRPPSTPSGSFGSTGPVSAMALHDWRFSHSSPSLLININIKSLLQSPIWKALFAGANVADADLEKARAALGDIGQILISISPNHTSSPSVL